MRKVQIPNNFNIKNYINLKTNEVFNFEDVEDVLNYETEKIFENYYNDIKQDKLFNLTNNLMHRLVYEKAQEYLDILLTGEYFKQRDALNYLESVKIPRPFNKAILADLVKNYPKSYKTIIQRVLNEIKAFKDEISIDYIESLVMDEDDLLDLTQTLSVTKAKETIVNNYINNLILYLYNSVINEKGFDSYIDKEVASRMPKIEEELVKEYDKYRYKKFDTYQQDIRQEIVNLYDYTIGKCRIQWLDINNRIYLVKCVDMAGSKITLVSEKNTFVVNRSDIKEISYSLGMLTLRV